MNFRDSWIVAKKDLLACLKDKIILIQIFVIPFIIVFGYGMLMGAMGSSSKPAEGENANVYYVHAPAAFESAFQKLGYQKAEENEIDAIKDKVKNKKANLLIVFPKDFSMKQQNTGEKLDDISLWYNSEKNSSFTMFNQASAILNEFQPRAFTVNASTEQSFDLGDVNAAFKSFLGMIFPIMVLMSVFMICMNLAAQSIAGDKERGFMNTLLITPVKRGSLALGKSLCLFITAILGGISAFIGMALSIPQVIKSVGAGEGFSLGFMDYILLFGVTITGIFALVGVLLIVSTVAKDVKQATTIAPLFMMILMIVGMLTMSDNFKDIVDNFGIGNYFIPAWNTMRVMQDIIELKHNLLSVGITCGINLLVTIFMIWVVGKLFQREKMLTD